MAKVNWTMDPTHSELQFKVRHLMISSVSGEFTKFNAEVQTEGEDFMKAKVVFTVDSDSVDTGNAQRDGHLKSPDFFDSAKYPQIKFVTTKYENVDKDGSYEVYGDLTIRDVTKNVRMDVEFGGIIKDPWGNTRAGFIITGKINRKDYGLEWNAVTESGGVVVGDEVKLHAALEFIEKT